MIKFGNLTIQIGDKVLYELDIIAKNDIRKKEIADYYKEFLYNMSYYLTNIILDKWADFWYHNNALKNKHNRFVLYAGIV